MPVVDGDRLAGLITSERLLALLTEMLAVDIPAVRATMKMPMKKGELAKLVSGCQRSRLGDFDPKGVFRMKKIETCAFRC